MPGISAVLLVAGESTRMGQPKALLQWRGKTLLQHQTETLEQAGLGEIVVVLGYRALDVVIHVRGARARSVINRDYAQGKTTSIRRGLSSIDPAASGVLLLAVDQPRPVNILKRLLEEHQRQGALITAPEHQGRMGHPPIFRASLLPELLAIDEASQGLRAVMERHQQDILRVPFDTPLVHLDVNSQEQYQEALRLLEEA